MKKIKWRIFCHFFLSLFFKKILTIPTENKFKSTESLQNFGKNEIKLLMIFGINFGILFLGNYSGVPRLRSQREGSISRPSLTESAYVQTVPDGRCLCPDFRAFTRILCVHCQTFVRSPDFRAFMSRLFCVQQTFVRSTDFRAFMSRILWVRQTFVCLTDFCTFMSRL